jgi:hypothetical protein
MASDIQTGSERTITSLVTGILSDAQELIKQQLALTREEIKEDVRRTKDAILFLGAGIGVATVGGLLLLFMLVHFLSWAFPGLPLWGSFGLVGGLLVVLGLGMFFAGKQLFESFNPLPDQSAAALRENVQWLTPISHRIKKQDSSPAGK